MEDQLQEKFDANPGEEKLFGSIQDADSQQQTSIKSPQSLSNSQESESVQKRKYVKKKDLEDPAYMPSTSMMYKRRRKRRVSMGGLLEGSMKGLRPVNERNIERILDKSLELTDSMLQLLLSSKDDLKRLCGVGAGGVSSGLVASNVETLSVETLAKHANKKKLMEIVEKINKAYVEYHKTIDNLSELGKGQDNEEDMDDIDDDDDLEEEYSFTKNKYNYYDKAEEKSTTKRPYHRKQPYNKKHIKSEPLSYQGNHHEISQDDSSSFYDKNNHDSISIEDTSWQIKKEKPWDWSEERGHDADVSNDLVMTCEPGSDDESLYNVGFPKFRRNY